MFHCYSTDWLLSRVSGRVNNSRVVAAASKPRANIVESKDMLERRMLLKSAGAVLASAALDLSLCPTYGFAQGAPKITTKGVYAAPGLSFSGIFIANDAGTWGKNGLNAEVRLSQSGAWGH
jgi:hypothetical protein